MSLLLKGDVKRAQAAEIEALRRSIEIYLGEIITTRTQRDILVTALQDIYSGLYQDTSKEQLRSMVCSALKKVFEP